MTFAEFMATNPPRLVVQFRRDANGGESFDWGVVGNMPGMSIIGAVVRAQADLAEGKWIPGCESDPPALVIAWHGAEKRFEHWVHRDIPVEPLVGMIEVVKTILVSCRIQEMAAAAHTGAGGILGPDGRPMRSF